MKTYATPSLSESYKMYFQYAYMFGARSRRFEYVSILLGNTIIYMIDFFAAICFADSLGIISAVIFGGIAIAVTIPWPALMIRRMHDVGHTAIRLLIFLLPFVGWSFYFGYVLFLCIKDSDEYVNDWGESPKYYDE